ncbi:MAG: hypothetical protein R2798_05895 [Chitinophagales bacterium]
MFSNIFILIFIFTFIFSTIFEKWYSNAYYYCMIGGKLPIVDAWGYMLDSYNYIYFKKMSGLGLWKPLYVFINTGLFWLCNENILYFQLLSTTLLALSCFGVAYLLNKIWGISAAIIFAYFSTLFIHDFTGAYLSEPLGFTFGNIAVFFLIWSLYKNNIYTYILGIFILSIGMTIRPGAPISLVFLWLFGVIYWRKAYFKKVNIKTILLLLLFFLSAITPKLMNQQLNKKFSTNKIVKKDPDNNKYLLLVSFIQTGSMHNFSKMGDLYKGQITKDNKYTFFKDEAFRLLKEEPSKFIKNYLSFTQKILQDPINFYYAPSSKLKYNNYYLSIIIIALGFFTFLFLYYRKKENGNLHVFIFLMLMLLGELIFAFIQHGSRTLSTTAPFRFVLMAFFVYNIIQFVLYVFKCNVIVPSVEKTKFLIIGNIAIISFLFLISMLVLILPPKKIIFHYDTYSKIDNTENNDDLVVIALHNNFLNFSNKRNYYNISPNKTIYNKTIKKEFNKNNSKAIVMGINLLNPKEKAIYMVDLPISKHADKGYIILRKKGKLDIKNPKAYYTELIN